MTNKNPHDLADEWKAAINARDLHRIMRMYSEGIVFKSPRVITVAGEASGTLRGKAAVRAYWAKILERRPDLECTVGRTYSPASIASPWNTGSSMDRTA